MEGRGGKRTTAASPATVSVAQGGALVGGLVDFDNIPTALHKDGGAAELIFTGGLAGDHPCSLRKTGTGTVRLSVASAFNGAAMRSAFRSRSHAAGG